MPAQIEPAAHPNADSADLPVNHRLSSQQLAQNIAIPLFISAAACAIIEPSRVITSVIVVLIASGILGLILALPVSLVSVVFHRLRNSSETTVVVTSQQSSSASPLTAWRKNAPSFLIPLVIVCSILLLPKAVAAPLLVLCLVGTTILILLPNAFRTRLEENIPPTTRDWIRTAYRQLKPFFFMALYLIAPLGLLTILGYSLLNLFKQKTKPGAPIPHGHQESTKIVSIRQYVDKRTDANDSNFFLSPAFSITAIALVASGLPFALVMLAYWGLGIDAIWHASADKQFALSIFIMYACGLGSCLVTLMLRAYFTFPLNFADEEYSIIFSEKGIEKTNVKGWFAELMWYGWHDFFPRSIEWDKITSITFEQSGYGRLYPLPDKLFHRDSLIYNAMNKMAAYSDAFIDRCGRAEYIVLRTQYEEHGGPTAGLKIRLWELNDQEKAHLFFALRKWAPALYVSEPVQRALVGSTIMRDTTYTQIWFDLLSTTGTRKRESAHKNGDLLRSGMYTVTTKIGAGGQATVYEAQCQSPPHKVVLKEFVLATGAGLDALAESARDFENEGSILRRLNHDGIVKLIDMFVEDHRAYLVLDLVEGTSLRKLVELNGPMPETQVLSLGQQMCAILAYLHKQSPSIVHCDFTPDNLILHHDRLKLVDFSVSRQDVLVSDQETALAAGKLAYSPPEQFRGEVCPQSDIYALGATFFFLAVGKDPEPITQSHPIQQNCRVSNDFDALVALATALDVKERYESVEWVSLELKRILNSCM